MKRLMLAVLTLASVCAGAPAFAAEPAAPCGSAKPEWCAGLYSGALSVVTRGEKREYLSARATVSGPVFKRLSAFARTDVTGTQDGGGLNLGDPKTFRTIDAAGGLRYPVGPVEASVVAGATYSIEGDRGRPVDARLFTLAALARVGFGDGGYVYAGGGHHGPVGGPALLLAASVPVKGGTYSVVDFAFPLTRTVFAEKAWVLKVGASVRVKTLRLPF